VMVVDFERAECVKPRPILGTISANRKRKREYNTGLSKCGEDGLSIFLRERNRVAIELHGLHERHQVLPGQ